MLIKTQFKTYKILKKMYFRNMLTFYISMQFRAIEDTNV